MLFRAMKGLRHQRARVNWPVKDEPRHPAAEARWALRGAATTVPEAAQPFVGLRQCSAIQAFLRRLAGGVWRHLCGDEPSVLLRVK